MRFMREEYMRAWGYNTRSLHQLIDHSTRVIHIGNNEMRSIRGLNIAKSPCQELSWWETWYLLKIYMHIDSLNKINCAALFNHTPTASLHFKTL